MAPKSRKKQPKPSNNKGRRGAPEHPQSVWLYGRHAVSAAMMNPERPLRCVLATKNARQWLTSQKIDPQLVDKVTSSDAQEIDRRLPQGAVHQGIAAEVDNLPAVDLNSICHAPSRHGPILVLDQITDPQNIGAIFRAAAGFGARAIIVQDRKTPPLSGALAKAAAGAIEVLPCVAVVNIARTLEALRDFGYHCAGLAGAASHDLDGLPDDQPIALVLGAEGSGLRRLVADTCDELYRIPISDRVESLNVSTATAVALYEINRSKS